MIYFSHSHKLSLHALQLMRKVGMDYFGFFQLALIWFLYTYDNASVTFLTASIHCSFVGTSHNCVLYMTSNGAEPAWLLCNLYVDIEVDRVCKSEIFNKMSMQRLTMMSNGKFQHLNSNKQANDA